MPRRTFGPSADTVTQPAELVSNVEEPVVQQEQSSSFKLFGDNDKLNNIFEKVSKPKVFVPVIAAVAAAIGVGTYFGPMDTGHGASSPEAAAVNFVNAASASSDQLWSYLPREIRDTKMGSAAVMWELDESTKAVLSNVQIKENSTKLVRNNISDIQSGYDAFYHKAVDVDDAISIGITADAAMVDGSAQPISFDILCIKSGMRWYVYTGADLSFMTSPQSAISDVFNGPSDPSVGLEPSAYAGVLDDLKAGKVTIDDKEYTMPCKYQDMTNVFQLADSAIEDDDRTLDVNMILKMLPVVRGDAVASNISVDIANPSSEPVDLADGYVSTLQIRRAKDDEDAVRVILPGNITFGMGKDVVKSVYGELDAYSGNDKDLNSFGYNSGRICQVQMDDTGYNWLYLIFDDDSNLYAVEWRYYDFDHMTN